MDDVKVVARAAWSDCYYF